MAHLERNVVGAERFFRGLIGASLVTCGLNGHSWGWLGVLFTATAILEFCPVRRLFEPKQT